MDVKVIFMQKTRVCRVPEKNKKTKAFKQNNKTVLLLLLLLQLDNPTNYFNHYTFEKAQIFLHFDSCID